jgi:hypothetical protein
MANDLPRQSEQMSINLRRSVGDARHLTFAFAEMSGKLGGAVNGAAQLAEGIARISKNARIAASATGIGAVVAIIGTIVAATIGWKEKTKDVAHQMRDIRNEIAVLEAKALGNKRLESERDIAASMAKELDAAEKLESIFRKFPELQAAIRAKAEAARKAIVAERDRTFADQQFDISTETGLLYGGMSGDPREQRRRQAEASRAKALIEAKRNREGFDPEQMAQLKQNIEDRFTAEMASIEYDTIKPLGDQLGRSFAGAIADGISAGISTHSFADGFRSLTGALLIGFGDMLQTIGTESLLAANLMQSIISALYAFAPLGAVGPALALIALGGILKGLGASMGGRRGGGGSGYHSPPPTTFVGVTTPAPAPNTAGLVAQAPVTVNAWIIGKDDPSAQRQLLEMFARAQRRGRTTG